EQETSDIRPLYGPECPYKTCWCINYCSRMTIHPRLVATSGPLQGHTLELVEDEVSLGRADDVTFTIDHMSVWRRHCLFLKDGANFKILDNASLNGTFVNGQQIKEQTLQHGDSVTVGNSTFVFLIEDDEPVASSAVTLTDLTIDSPVAVVWAGGNSDQILSMFGKRADGEKGVAVSNTVLAKVLRVRAALLTNNASESLSDARSL